MYNTDLALGMKTEPSDSLKIEERSVMHLLSERSLLIPVIHDKVEDKIVRVHGNYLEGSLAMENLHFGGTW